MKHIVAAIVAAGFGWAVPALAAEQSAEDKAVAQLLNTTDQALDDGEQYETVGSADEIDLEETAQQSAAWDLWIANTYRVKIEVLDGVKDGCWTNTNTANDAVELALSEHNIEINPDDDAGAFLILTGFGGRTEAGECVVTASIQLLHYVEVLRPAWFTFTDGEDSNFWQLTEVFARRNVLIGTPDEMSDIIKRYAVDQVSSLLLDIYKLRGRLPLKQSDG